MDLINTQELARTLMDKHGLSEWAFHFDSSKRCFGKCYFAARKITLSKKLCELNNEENVIDTILHEIAHALASKYDKDFGHGEAWKKWCVKVGAKPIACYDPVNIVTVGYNYSLINKETKEVYGYYHNKPKWASTISFRIIPSKPETFGKLAFITNK